MKVMLNLESLLSIHSECSLLIITIRVDETNTDGPPHNWKIIPQSKSLDGARFC